MLLWKASFPKVIRPLCIHISGRCNSSNIDRERTRSSFWTCRNPILSLGGNGEYCPRGCILCVECRINKGTSYCKHGDRGHWYAYFRLMSHSRSKYILTSLFKQKKKEEKKKRRKNKKDKNKWRMYLIFNETRILAILIY